MLNNMKRTLANNSKSRKFMAYFWVILVGVVLFLPNYLFIPYLHLNKSCPLSPFCSSISTPWGAFTSLFVFDGWTNLYGFIMWFAFLFLITVFMSADLVEDYAKFIALALFPIAIASNGIELIVWAVYNITALSYGASTLTYAFLGLLFGLSASVLAQNFKEHSWNDLVTVINAVVFGGILVCVIFFSSTLFSVAPHVGYIVHEIGFLIGTIAMFVYAKIVIFGKRSSYPTK